MIQTFIETKQTLSKDGFALKGEYKYKLKLLGVRLFNRTSTVDNTINQKNAFDENGGIVGFNKK